MKVMLSALFAFALNAAQQKQETGLGPSGLSTLSRAGRPKSYGCDLPSFVFRYRAITFGEGCYHAEGTR